jgi:hypothetical protein
MVSHLISSLREYPDFCRTGLPEQQVVLIFYFLKNGLRISSVYAFHKSRVIGEFVFEGLAAFPAPVTVHERGDLLYELKISPTANPIASDPRTHELMRKRCRIFTLQGHS